jgi:hypothetical protein
LIRKKTGDSRNVRSVSTMEISERPVCPGFLILESADYHDHMNWHLQSTITAISASLSVIATAVSIFALVRTYVLSHPKLMLIQQNRWGKNFLGYVGDDTRIGITILIANPRPQPNAIVDWKAKVEMNGKLIDVPVPSGTLEFSGEKKTPYGILPLTLPPFSAVEANLCLFDLPQKLFSPVKVKLIALDVSHKRHCADIIVEKVGP